MKLKKKVSRYHLDKNRLYELTSQIPEGMISTYKLLAEAIGKPKAARAVGKLLNSNPYPIIVPCHRIIHSDGRIGGYSNGVERKTDLLISEGVVLRNGRVVNYREILFNEFSHSTSVV
jgi:O-6-methylguanine DNA methyltransferase